MTWSKIQPTDTTKIRKLGEVIRPNWEAIEDGDASFKPKALNLNNRTVSGPSNDPSAITNTFILYCKEDGSGNPELFGINENMVVTQFTKGTPTLANNGSTFLPGGAIMKWGRFSIPAGSVIVTGITFESAFSSTPFSLVVSQTKEGGAISNRDVKVYDLTSTDFTAQMSAVNSTNATEFHYIAIGI